MRLEDLPARERRKVRRAIASGAVRAAAAPDVRPVGQRTTAGPPTAASTGRPDTHQCVPCGRTFSSYPAAERHVDRVHGHGRIACEL